MAEVAPQRFGFWSKSKFGNSDQQTVGLPLCPPPGLTQPDELCPPPGLDFPPPGLETVRPSSFEMEPRYAPLPASWNMTIPFTFEPVQYKVLLQNIPEPLLKECLLWTMFEQAKLRDVVDLTFRSNGRALVTLTSQAGMTKCIRHFNGRRWACSQKPVVAFQVRTVTKPAENVAPTYEKDDTRDRVDSSASTDSGRTSDDVSVSDDCASEKDSSSFSQ